MLKSQHRTLLFFLFFLPALSAHGSAWSAENAAALGVIDWRSKASDTPASEAPHSGAFSGAKEPKDEEREITALRGFVIPLADPRSLAIEDPSIPGGRLEAGRFESRASLKFRDGDYAFFEVAISIRNSEGEVRSALAAAEYRPGMTRILDDDTLADLEGRFLTEVRNFMEPLRLRFGNSVMHSFLEMGSDYVHAAAEQMPEALRTLKDRAREAEERGETQEPAYPVTQLSGSKMSDLSLRRELQENSQDVRIVQSPEKAGVFIPRYDARNKFILTDLSEDGQSRYFLASIDYRFSTIPLMAGSYRTVFAVSLRYKQESPVVYSEVFDHGERIEEKEFMPRWKNLFLEKMMEIFLERGGTAREKVEKALFVTYLEPYLYDLYYDFSPSFFKARMAFVGADVQSRIQEASRKKKI